MSLQLPPIDRKTATGKAPTTPGRGGHETKPGQRAIPPSRSGMRPMSAQAEAAATLTFSGTQPGEKHSASKIAYACDLLGIDPVQDLTLIYLAERLLDAELPEEWEVFTDDR